MSWMMGYSDWLYKNWIPFQAIAPFIGYEQARNTQQSLKAQMDYDQYLRGGNERALADWNRNVGWQGKTIAYPEFSYTGQIARANTSLARAGFDYATADASYYGNLPYRTAGLYGIATRISRTL